MTTRMATATVILTIGLAIAALAGIPALIENRAIGDVVVIVGLAIGSGGLVLLASGIPGQIRVGRQTKADRDTLAEHAKTDLRLAAGQRLTINTQLNAARNAARMRLGMNLDHREAQAEQWRLEVEQVRVEGAYWRAVAELKRYGLTVEEVLATSPE